MSGCIIQSEISDGSVFKLIIIDGGYGYSYPPVIHIDPPVSGIDQASAIVDISGQKVSNVIITNGGSGYIVPPIIFVEDEITPDIIQSIRGWDTMPNDCPYNPYRVMSSYYLYRYFDRYLPTAPTSQLFLTSGINGNYWTRGLTGPQGLRGPQGLTGAQGATGPVGSQAAGSNQQVQYNYAGSLAGSSNLIYDYSNNTLNVYGNMYIGNSSSTLNPGIIYTWNGSIDPSGTYTIYPSNNGYFNSTLSGTNYATWANGVVYSNGVILSSISGTYFSITPSGSGIVFTNSDPSNTAYYSTWLFGDGT